MAGPTWQAAHSGSSDFVERYSRQMMLPQFGVEAQERLQGATALVVGLGGLGSPVALYLAAAGFGRLVLVDQDTVERSNLHRQVIHGEDRLGQAKAASAAAACQRLNPGVKVEPHSCGFTPHNAVALVRDCTVAVDASDNAPTRYLLSDACAVLRRPLVSGAAIGTDGQLTVYCHGKDGPCYRCLFPEPPQAASCASCADAGVLGVVPGVVGVLQAAEAIKVAAGVGRPLSRRLTLYDALEGSLTQVKLRAKVPTCVACGSSPQLTADTIAEFDYCRFTGTPSHDRPLPALQLLQPDQRLQPRQVAALLREGASASPPVVLDVRPRAQFDMAHLPGSVSAPYDPNALEALAAALRDNRAGGQSAEGAVVVCRRGNDSQRAVAYLQSQGFAGVRDMVGGLTAWHREVDADFPGY